MNTDAKEGLAARAGSAKCPEKEWPSWFVVNRVRNMRDSLGIFANGTESQRPGAAGAQKQACDRDAGIRQISR